VVDRVDEVAQELLTVSAEITRELGEPADQD
jgi:hypothetical protein